jgi:hypothetical protein
MKEWLARPANERLSTQQVFESLDLQRSGELTS